MTLLGVLACTSLFHISNLMLIYFFIPILFTSFFLDGYVNLFKMLKRPGGSPNTAGSKFLLHLTVYTFPTV